MVKYSMTKAQKVAERVDPCSHDMEEGPHVDSATLGALVIDLIFTSKAPWLRCCCDVDMSPMMRRFF